MEIVVVAPSFFPATGGYAHACTGFVQAIAAGNDFKIRVVTPAPLGDAPELIEPNVEIVRIQDARPFVVDTRIWIALVTLARRRQFDFVLFETAEFPLAGLLALASFGVGRVVVRVHAASETEWVLYRVHPVYMLKRLPTRLMFRYTRYIMSTTHHYVEFVKRFFLKDNPLRIADKRFEVIPNVVPDLRSPSGGQRDYRREEALPTAVEQFIRRRVTLFTLGRADAHGELQKNFARLVDAVALTHHEYGHHSVGLVVVGAGETMAARRLQAERLGISEAVYMQESLPWPVVRALQHRCSAVVLASTFEGMSMFALESLEAGAPLLAAGNGGLRDLVEDGRNGLTFDPFDPSDIAATIDLFVREMVPELEAVRSEAKRVFDERFKPEKTARRFAMALERFAVHADLSEAPDSGR